MGSLPSPPPSPSPENNLSNYVMVTIFCPKEPTPNVITLPNSMYLYYPSINTWTYAGTIPGLIDNQVLKDFSMVSLGGKSKVASTRGISSAELYDPDIDTWTPLPNLHILRYKCLGVTWKNKVYIVGGFAEREDSDMKMSGIIERSSAEVLNMQAKKWDLITGMWQLDVPPYQIVAVNDTLYSSGDCLNAWKGHVEAYDNNIWNEVDGSHNRSLSTLEYNYEYWSHQRRLYLTMAPIGNKLFFLAGYRVDDRKLTRTISVVHVFDTSATIDPWGSFEPMEFEDERELCSHCCVVQLSPP
ncbi:kelch-like protein [Trifolium pratense]|uniref:Kelch-like protein n=1 Tax=Trifolium pratense TaxID=57577 RepID=A0A2K3M418_TRIPR|nr:kelch-like protein [Trifolium pratense]PNX85528.1 kelch-like protein [Trifolium pratense]PNY10879.1 kelch-like protein [Trifolium pratense]